MASKKKVEVKSGMCANQTKLHTAAVEFLHAELTGKGVSSSEPSVKIALIQFAERIVFPV